MTITRTEGKDVGLFVYALLVAPVGHFSGYAGSVALALIMRVPGKEL